MCCTGPGCAVSPLIAQAMCHAVFRRPIKRMRRAMRCCVCNSGGLRCNSCARRVGKDLQRGGCASDCLVPRECATLRAAGTKSGDAYEAHDRGERSVDSHRRTYGVERASTARWAAAATGSAANLGRRGRASRGCDLSARLTGFGIGLVKPAYAGDEMVALGEVHVSPRAQNRHDQQIT